MVAPWLPQRLQLRTVRPLRGSLPGDAFAVSDQATENTSEQGPVLCWSRPALHNGAGTTMCVIVKHDTLFRDSIPIVHRTETLPFYDFAFQTITSTHGAAMTFVHLPVTLAADATRARGGGPQDHRLTSGGPQRSQRTVRV
jgi:hypothetical protein